MVWLAGSVICVIRPRPSRVKLTPLPLGDWVMPDALTVSLLPFRSVMPCRPFWRLITRTRPSGSVSWYVVGSRTLPSELSNSAGEGQLALTSGRLSPTIASDAFGGVGAIGENVTVVWSTGAPCWQAGFSTGWNWYSVPSDSVTVTLWAAVAWRQ